MQIVGVDIANEIASGTRSTAKVVFNRTGAIFFPATEQHRDQRAPGISYEDDHKGNALAALLTDKHFEIRFHPAFSDEQVRELLGALTETAELSFLQTWATTYQARSLG
jgi:hypothetical protein